MNAKDFFDMLERAKCSVQKGPIRLICGEDEEYDNLIVKYNDVFFIIMYQIDGGLVKKALALTERDIYPSDALDATLTKFERFAKLEDVFIEREFNQDFSEDGEDDYFSKLVKKSIYGGNYAWVNLVKNPINALNNLYVVLQKSVDFFKRDEFDKIPKIIRG